MKTKQSYVDLILVFIKVTHSLFLHFQTTIQFHFYVTTEKVSHFVFLFLTFFFAFSLFVVIVSQNQKTFKLPPYSKPEKEVISYVR